MMSDANGIGTGGTSEASIVQPLLNTTSTSPNTTTSPSPSSCLRSASINATSLDFTFSLSGSAAQCQPGLEITWTGGSETAETAEMAPYNYTLVPLDKGFMSWTVKVPGDGEGEWEGEGWLDDWVVNMTAGTRFTMIMSSAKGYGRGGVSGAYEISPSPTTSSNDTETDTSCNLLQPPLPTGSWPASALLNTLPTASLSSNSPSTSSPDSAAAARRRATAGRIAGTVVGVLLGIVLCLLGGWVWRRRRVRRKLGPRVGGEKGSVDLSPEASPRQGQMVARPVPVSSLSREEEQEPETGVSFFPAVHPGSGSGGRIEPYPLDLGAINSGRSSPRERRARGRGQGEAEQQERESLVSSAGSVAASGAPTAGLDLEWEEEAIATATATGTGTSDTKPPKPSSHRPPPSQPPPKSTTSLLSTPRPPSFAPRRQSPAPSPTPLSSAILGSSGREEEEEEGEEEGEEEEGAKVAVAASYSWAPVSPGGMHLTNPDTSTPLAPPPPTRGHPRPRPSLPPPPPAAPTGEPTYRRHADAGPVPDSQLSPSSERGRQGEVVDLPPLYSEVPRDGEYS
ncbi:hypothetical protein L202_05164 [Cryptococcus amylolentus CBS 6039]|uniref:Uncharacterized protein n=1 Tax=Cryptococcus amylolentus CBS 6039 TaxID=1295533 RepID=A0A1E3HJH8_9TREE|nr:hypothetical protein L202_05164 [Cryptococcus amylolentus CBS 6039]ODN76498.1 hypothetical protein L202_05164 [Cryptococcus amylolentus CBS 6039]